jgi:uncharacterized protein YoxC
LNSLEELSITKRLEDLEKNLADLFLSYNSLEIQIQEKTEDITALKSIITSLSDKVKELNDKNKNLKLACAMQGNSEHSQLMKVRLNKLIHEVDVCMKQVTGF